MRHVKVADAAPGMVMTGTVERGDLTDAPFEITSVTKVGLSHYRIAVVTLSGVDAGNDIFPGHARLKIIG